MSTDHIHEAQWTPGVPGVKPAPVAPGGGGAGAQPAATPKTKRGTPAKTADTDPVAEDAPEEGDQ